MTTRHPFTLSLTILALVFALLPAAVPAAEPSAASRDQDPQTLANRLENVARLVTSSSGAQRVEASGNPAAQSRLEEARDLYRQARSAYDGGDAARASELLHETTVVLFDAVKLAGTGGLAEQKERRDFDARAESVDVLLKALERIGDEKGTRDSTAQQIALTRRLVNEADLLADEGRIQEGRRVLDGAYEMAKTSIEEQRGGDTLVRSLHFESKQEEYDYEVDRNETHKMLVIVLLRDKGNTDRMVQRFIDQASELRQDADHQAASGDYEAAIETLEESTQNLVRAIRAAGVYIPG